MDFLKQVSIVDLETTDLDPFKARLAAICAQRGMVGHGGTFHTLVKLPLGMGMPEEAYKVNKLHADVLATHGLHPDNALQALQQFVGSNLIVAHNAGYDIAVLDQAYLRHGLDRFRNNFLCTKTLAVALLPGHKSYSLEKLCIDLSLVADEQAHTAQGDVAMTSKLLVYLLAQPNAASVAESLMNKCGKGKAHYAPKQYLPVHAEEILQE